MGASYGHPRRLEAEPSVKPQTVPCANCGAESPVVVGGGIDNGWCISAVWMGYYGGFTDICGLESEEEYRALEANICHDCCHKLLDALPGLAKVLLPFGSGAHSLPAGAPKDSPPCCRYCWTFKNEPCPNCEYPHTTYGGTDEGTWVKKPCPNCDGVVDKPCYL